MRRWVLWASLGANAVVALSALALVAIGPHRLALWVLRPARERLVSFFAANPVAAGDVVLLGDSLTDGARWNELLPGVAVRNRGVPADTTADVLARLDQVTAGRPARVLLMIGTNDLGQGASVADTAARYREILTRLERESATTRVYVQSVLPRGESYREDVESLNREIQEAAREHGAVWIDLYPDFLAADGSIRDDLSNDELHLLGPGYTLWRDRIAAHLDARRTPDAVGAP
jgi:lysophospholipase L1-like esterase